MDMSNLVIVVSWVGLINLLDVVFWGFFQIYFNQLWWIFFC